MRTHLLRLAALSVVGVIAACGPSQTPPPDDKKDPTPPSASFETDQLTVKESDGSAPIVVVLSKATDKVVTALITTADGDVSCEIPAGETQCTVDFAIADDDVVEADEVLTFELASVTNATRAEPTTLTVTVEDDDVTLPSAAFALAARTLDEPSQAVIELRLNIAAPREVRVPFTVSGTASSADHTLVDGEFVVAAGETSAQVAFEILDDEIDEQDETIIVTLGTPQNAVLGSLKTQTITINDDDAAPVAAFAAATLSVDENAEAPVLVVTLDRPSDRVVAVPFTVSGTATSADHTLVDGEFTFPAGETSAQVTFALIDDALDEEDETIIVTLGEATNAITGTLSTLTITIADDDDAPSVSFTTDAQTISESVVDASVDIELSAPSGRTITVHITLTTDGREPFSGSLQIEPGNTTLSLPLYWNDNEFNEPDRTGVITIDSLENAVAGTFMTHTVTVTDDDPPSVVTFAAAAQTVTEGDGVTALVTLDRPSGFTVEAEYRVVGTATSADHTLVAGKLTFLPGETEKAITFNVIDDDVYEGNETIQIVIGALTHATIGDVPTHTVTVVESLPAVTVSFDAAADSISESGPSYTLSAKLSGKSAFPVTVPFTVSGTATSADHNLVDGEFTFEPGETVASVVIALTGDSLYEQDETVVVTLGTPVNAAVGAYGVFTLTLEDDDAQPMVAFTIASSSVAENAQGAQVIGLSLDGAAAQDVVVTIEVEDAAQATTLASGTVTIPAGQTSGEILFNVIDNDRDGDDKTVIVTLVEATVAALGDKTTHTLTVTDDDEAPTVSFARTPVVLSEGESIDLELKLSAVSEKTVTAPFSIYSSEAKQADYTLGGTQVTFAPGETSATVTFEAHADDLYEGHQDILLQLDPPTNATAGGFQTVLVTILEATDVPTLALKTTAAKQAEGTTVTLDVELSGPVAFDASFTWKALFVAGTDTADADDVVISSLTGTIAAGQTTGQISFALAADGVREQEESFRVQLESVTFRNQNNVRYDLQHDTTPATITIAADPSEPVATIATDATTLFEGSDTSVTFTVTLDAAFEAQTAVALAYSGTAQSGVDFTPVASVTFGAGETEKDVVVSLVDNDEFRLDRTLTVAVAAGAGYEVGTPASATVTLVDDEPVTKMAGLKAHLDATTIEGVADGERVTGWAANGEAGTVQFDSVGLTDPLYVESSIAGLPAVRFSASAHTELASVGEVELTSDAATGMTVIVVGKAQLDSAPGHFWQVGLSADALGLVANDDGSLSLETESNWLLSDANAVRSDVWALSTTLVGATGSARGSAALFLDGQELGTAANDLTSPAALSGAQRLIIGGDRDLNLLTGEIAEVMFFGRELNDAERGLIECHLSEKYRLLVQGCAAPPYTATITADQETVTEGTDLTATFTVTLDRAAAADTVVELDYSGNADPDTDYTAPASVTVPAGQTSTTLEVTLVDDDEDRGERTLTVHISANEDVFAGTPSSAAVTIEDDDAEEEEEPLTNHVVISEFAVQGPGGASDEFIELYNPTNEEVTIVGWKLQYASATGAFNSSVTLPAGAVIKAKGYYLVTHTSYAANGGATADTTWNNFTMSNSGGNIRLVDAQDSVIDTVGFGSGTKGEGASVKPVHGSSGSFERKAVETSTLATMEGGDDALRGNGWDSDNNANDFVVRTTRNPQNAKSGVTEKP